MDKNPWPIDYWPTVDIIESTKEARSVGVKVRWIAMPVPIDNVYDSTTKSQRGIYDAFTNTISLVELNVRTPWQELLSEEEMLTAKGQIVGVSRDT